jgi:hypothetical protein
LTAIAIGVERIDSAVLLPRRLAEVGAVLEAIVPAKAGGGAQLESGSQPGGDGKSDEHDLRSSDFHGAATVPRFSQLAR